MRLSYKGEKEKNIEDVHDFMLLFPMFEYHNVTWTWLDFLLAVRNDTKRVLISQVVKQKLRFMPRTLNDDVPPSPQEEDKARIILGDMVVHIISPFISFKFFI